MPKKAVPQQLSDPGVDQGPSKLRANREYLTGTGSTQSDDSGPPPF
jgi:hypothetical protein